MEGRTDPQSENVESGPYHDLFGQPLVTTEITGMFWVRRSHGHHHGPDCALRLTHGGCIVRRSADSPLVDGIGEIDELDVGQRREEGTAIMQVAYRHLGPEVSQRIDAFIDRAGQHSHLAALLAQPTRDVPTGGPVTTGGADHQNCCCGGGHLASPLVMGSRRLSRRSGT